MNIPDDLDIIAIDNQIKLQFQNEKYKTPQYQDSLNNIIETIKITHTNNRIKHILIEEQKKLEEYIDDITHDKSLNFYLSDTTLLLHNYKYLMKQTVIVDFMNSRKITKSSKEKNNIITTFINIARLYIDIDINVENNSKTGNKHEKCNNCPNKKDFDIIDNNTYICLKCFSEQLIIQNVSSYRDIDRVNISTKYVYNRVIHMRDTIAQLQAKQNNTIEQKVYDDIEEQLILHHLILPANQAVNKIDRYKHINKDQILIFLKELNYSRHYENIHLIHYNITGKPPICISHLEDKILEDFNKILEVYDTMFKDINRKNFICSNYILWQLLLKHKFTCKRDDFTTLKRIERKLFHDNIYSQIAAKLDFPFSPLI